MSYVFKRNEDSDLNTVNRGIHHVFFKNVFCKNLLSTVKYCYPLQIWSESLKNICEVVHFKKPHSIFRVPWPKLQSSCISRAPLNNYAWVHHLKEFLFTSMLVVFSIFPLLFLNTLVSSTTIVSIKIYFSLEQNQFAQAKP